MYRSILVPLDGSPLSEYALPTAYDIACRSGATLGLLHVHQCVTPTPIYVEGMPVIDERGLSLSKMHELAYLERIRDQGLRIMNRLQDARMSATARLDIARKLSQSSGAHDNNQH